tara:strand:- start:16925 stop:18358 length:1434 start_codon:yes stop_codon:yes gene_type:complete
LTDLLLVLLSVAGIWGVGLAAAHVLLSSLLRSTQTQTSLTELLGLGLVFGFGTTAFFYFLWGWVGGSYSSTVAWSWMCCGLLLGPVTLIRQFRNARTVANASDASATDDDFKKLCLGILLFLCLSTVIQSLMTPQRFWDERAIFGLKAIVLFQEGTLQNEALQHPDFVQYHPKYPLLIPLNETHSYLLLGEVNDRWSKIMFPLLYLGMLLCFQGVLQRTTRQSARAWLFTLMLATVPSMIPWEYGFLSGQADGPIACFHTITLLYLWSYLTESKKSAPDPAVLKTLPLVAGLSAGMTVFTKDEGIAFFLIDLIAVSIVGLLYFRGRLLTLAFSVGKFALITLLFIAPWLLYRRHLPATTEMAYFSRMQITNLSEGVAALQWAVTHLLQCMFLEAWSWGLQWWALMISLFAFPARALQPQQLFLLLNLTGALAALIIAGMIAPTPVQEHIGGSSLRFLLQISGGALLFIAGQWMEESP